MRDRGLVWCAQPNLEPPGLDFGGTAALCEVEDRLAEEEGVKERGAVRGDDGMAVMQSLRRSDGGTRVHE